MVMRKPTSGQTMRAMFDQKGPVPPRTILGVNLAVLVIVAIQFSLPDSVTIGPIWLVPLLEVTGVPVVMFITARHGEIRQPGRFLVNAYLTALVAASVMNAVLLLTSLLRGAAESGSYLLYAGFAVLAANVLSFGIVYWWIDGGGPAARADASTAASADFLFPQQAQDMHWRPSLTDYCFTAYTNIIAFSPTDTMPLTHRVKYLFVIQSSTALLTIVVTLSRAVNLIPSS